MIIETVNVPFDDTWGAVHTRAYMSVREWIEAMDRLSDTVEKVLLYDITGYRQEIKDPSGVLEPSFYSFYHIRFRMIKKEIL